MTLSEFTSEKERKIVRTNVIFTFHQYKENWTLIEVSLMGLPRYDGCEFLHNWVSATTLVTDMEAEAIYTNLLEKEWD